MVSEKSDKGRLARWWDDVSHHPLWAALIAALIAALVAAAIIAHSGGIFGGDFSAASSTSNSPSVSHHQVAALRVLFQPVAPELYMVAFDYDIGLPKDDEQWQGLHERGGVDLRNSNFRLTLADRSGQPLTVTNIEAVVYGASQPAIRSIASVYTQGAAGIEQFGVELDSEATGATSPFHRVENGVYTPTPFSAPLFFHDHNIALAPREIYEAKVAVADYESHKSSFSELDYGFIITGNTASGPFTYRSPHFKILGYPHTSTVSAREYWELGEASGKPCWIPANKSGTEPQCP